MNPALVWAIFGILMIIVEIFTPSFFAACIGISALLTAPIALIPNSAVWQWIVFIVLNVIMFAYVRKIVLKFLYNGDTREVSNVSALIGKECLVIEKIDNLKGTGYVKIYGDKWKARSSEEEIIEKDTIVVVLSVSGNSLIVKKK